MQALAVTIFLSLCLAGIFVISFTLECRRRRNGSSSPEHDALLPFDDGEASPKTRPHDPPQPKSQD